tara:strand:+ start:1410 stop:1814 length:405 start_codon:yes stop_codon:yes gene_type:complete
MTKMGLTPKQKQLFDFIRMYQKEKGQSPSYDEMLVGVGGKARSLITNRLKKLKERGYVDYIPHVARSVTVVGDLDKTEMKKLKNIEAAARLFFSSKDEWDQIYKQDPDHPSNKTLATKVNNTYNQLNKLVMGEY